MEKMTNLIAMNYVIDNYELPADVLEKMCNMRDSLIKKSTTHSKANAELNAQIGGILVSALASLKAPMTINEIISLATSSPNL